MKDKTRAPVRKKVIRKSTHDKPFVHTHGRATRSINLNPSDRKCCPQILLVKMTKQTNTTNADEIIQLEGYLNEFDAKIRGKKYNKKKHKKNNAHTNQQLYK